MDIADKYFELDDTMVNILPTERISKLIELWNTFPEPKIETKNSYLIVDDIVKTALNNNLLDIAWTWALIALKYDGIRNLAGEGAFRVGEVAFAKGDIETAKSYFKKTRKTGGLRMFKNKNPEYRKLLDD
jgi:hypothetical protein